MSFEKIAVLTLLLTVALSVIAAAETDWCYEYGQRGEFDKQIEACTSTISSGKYTGPDLAALYSNRATAYYDKGNYDMAIADYGRAIELMPGNAYYHNNRGAAYASKGYYDSAMSDYNKAIELNPKYARAYYNRGKAYNAKGDRDRAISDYTKAIELKPKYAAAYNNRGYAYQSKGYYDKAISDYTKAIELNPKDATAYGSRGIAAYYNGNYDRAIADYTKAIELNPRDEYSRIWLLLASRKLSRERTSAYAAEFTAYVKANTSTEWVRALSKYYLGIDGLTEQGVLEEAQHGKNDKEIREHLCQAYYYLGEERLWKGDRTGAQELFQKSVETKEYNVVEHAASKAMLRQMESQRN